MSDACLIRNPGIEPFTLPYPLVGTLAGGRTITFPATVDQVLAAAPSIIQGVKLTALPADYSGPFDAGFDLAGANSIVPTVDNADDVGSALLRWRRGYFGSGVITPTLGPVLAQQHTVPAVASDVFSLLGAAQSFTGVKTFVADPLFAREAAHVLEVAASTTADTVGGALTVKAGNGVGNANGGACTFDSGAKAGTGTDGACNVGTVNAESVSIGRTSKTTTINGGLAVTQVTALNGGVSGHLEFVAESNHVVYVAASTTADTNGGDLSIAAGDGAATNANGGALDLDAGAKAGTGTDGAIAIGTINAESVTIGRTGKTATVAGSLEVTEATTLVGPVGVGGGGLDCAALAVTSTERGFLFPRMTEAERDLIATPLAGLVVYNSTTNKLNLRVAAGWEVITSA